MNEAECGLYCARTRSRRVHGPQTSWARSHRRLRHRQALPRERRSLPVPVTPRQRPSAWVWWSRARPFFSMGSSMFYYYCTDHFVGSYVSPQGNGALKGGKAFTVPGTYCLGDGTNAAGTLTRWCVTCCTAKSWTPKSRAANAYAVMAREAAAVPPGSDGLIMLPYIYGERSPCRTQRPPECSSG